MDNITVVVVNEHLRRRDRRIRLDQHRQRHCGVIRVRYRRVRLGGGQRHRGCPGQTWVALQQWSSEMGGKSRVKAGGEAGDGDTGVVAGPAAGDCGGGTLGGGGGDMLVLQLHGVHRLVGARQAEPGCDGARSPN